MKRQSLLTIFALLYVGLFCYLGLYAQPSADDYNLANMVNSYGFWQAQVQWYTTWASAPIALAMTSIPAWLDFKVYGMLPIISCFFNVCAFYALIHIVSKGLTARKKLSIALLAQAICLAAVPGLNENFFWLCAMPYTWAGTLLVFTSALFILFIKQGANDLKTGLACAASLFIASAYTPQVAPFLCVVLFCLAILSFAAKKRKAVIICVAALVISFAGFLVLYLAPGTAARMAYTRMGDLKEISFISVRLLRTFIIAAGFGTVTLLKFFTKPIVYVFLLFLPSIAENIAPLDQKISSKLKVWHILTLVALIAPFQQAIPGWAQGGGFPARAEGLVIWIMGATWVFLWTFGYRNEATFGRIKSLRLYQWRGVLLVLCLLLSGNFISLLRDLPLAPSYAAEYRERDALIAQQKSEGKTDIVVPALITKPKLLFLADIGPFPQSWLNGSVADYWGVQSIIALPEPLSEYERAMSDLREGKLSGLEALAEAGDPETQYLLGQIYNTRADVMYDIPKDNTEAIKWYRMAAEQGHATSSRRLSRFYALGLDVPKNYLYALGWLLRSQF